jgi:hypothetical protein
MEYKKIMDEIDRIFACGKMIDEIAMNPSFCEKLYRTGTPRIFTQTLEIHNIKFYLDNSVKDYEIITK